jgi:nucleotide-binding universal stress UspA family protein
MTARQPPAGRFGRAVVGLHRTDRDAGLLGYVGMLARADIVSEVQCVHVMAAPPDDPAGPERVLTEMRAEADRYLGVLPAAARVTFDIRHGPLVDKLLVAVTEHRADVALIGHRQDHPLRRSLARRLAKLARCSVWLVPDGSPAAVTRVLVPIDFSAAAGHALEAAAGLASLLGLS